MAELHDLGLARYADVQLRLDTVGAESYFNSLDDVSFPRYSIMSLVVTFVPRAA